MTDSRNNDWADAIGLLLGSIKKLENIYGESWIGKNPEEFSNNTEAKIAYEEYVMSILDIRKNMRPDTIVPGIINGQNIDIFRKLSQEKEYCVAGYIQKAINTCKDCDNEEGVRLLSFLLNLPYFDPDTWLKKEDALPPLYVRGAGVPKWIENRYREAVYTYVYGFNNATVALCRSIIEGILKIKLEGKTAKNLKLHEMINYFTKTLKEHERTPVVWNTHKIKELADDVLHDLKTSAQNKDALRILSGTRDFVVYVYK
jgi:hypothetical protein